MKLNIGSIVYVIVLVSLSIASFRFASNSPEIENSNFQDSIKTDDSLSTTSRDRQKILHLEQLLAQTREIYDKKIVDYDRKIKQLYERIRQLQQREESSPQLASTNDDVVNTLISLPSMSIEDTPENDQELFVFELEEQLAREHRDAEWAEPIESQMTGVITEELRLAGNGLVGTNCGNSFCRIEFDHENELAESQFFMALAGREDLIDKFQDVFVHRVAASDSGDQMLHSVFFIAREGYELPFSTDILEQQ